MLTTHFMPAAAALGDGRVLVVGQSNRRSGPPAELYDPRARTWSRAPDPPAGFDRPQAAFRLGNGRLLVLAPDTRRSGSTAPPEAAEFDDQLGWILIPNAPGVGAQRFAAAPIDGDNILVAGGQTPTGQPVAEASVFNARATSWFPLPPLPEPRTGSSAASLGDGHVLVAGGYRTAAADTAPLDTAAVYEGAAGWKAAASLPGLAGTYLLLPAGPGHVLAAIGGKTPLAAIYDEAADTWTPTHPLYPLPASAALRPDGSIVFAGGATPAPSADAELYDPSSAGWSELQSMSTPRFGMTLVTLGDGSVMVLGGLDKTSLLTDAEIFGGPPLPANAAGAKPATLPEPGWLAAGIALALLGFAAWLAAARRRTGGMVGGVGRLALQVGGVILLTWALLASAHLLVNAQAQSHLAVPGFFHQPLAQVLWQATGLSLVLVSYAAAGAAVAGLGSAILVVSLRERRLVGLDLAGAVLLVVPTFLIAILVQELQAQVYGRTGLILAAGYGSVNSVQVFWAAVVLGIRPATYLYRHGRAVLERESTEDYVRTAEAKGIEWAQVVRRHLLRAGGSALVVVWANSFRILIGSLPLVEYFFGYPGLGRVLVQSIGIHYGPKPVVLRGDIAIGLVVILALLLILVEGAAGGLRRWLDPRLRLLRAA